MHSVIDVLRRQLDHRPEKDLYIFLEDGETETGRLSYAGLDAAARRIAAGLRKHWREGERLLLLYPPGQAFIEAFFGCIYAGFVAVPAFPPMQPDHVDRLVAIAADAEVAGLLTSNDLAFLVRAQVAALPSLTALPILATDTLEAADFSPVVVEPEDLVYLQYTSGSTGAPKGVMVGHANLMANERVIEQAFGHSEETIGCGWLPVYHDMGLVGKVIQPLFCGGTVVLMPPLSFLKRPLHWLRAIDRYRATTAGAPSFAYELCVRRYRAQACEDLDLRSWEVAFCGAEPVRASTLRRFADTFGSHGFRRDAFYPCYGLAEATLMVSGPPKMTPTSVLAVDREQLEKEGAFVPAGDAQRCGELVGCGKPWGDTEVLIVDPESKVPCAPGTIGEIWVAGTSVTLGYWKKRADTQKTFQARTSAGRGPYLRTGDLGFCYNGELFVSGRLKDMLILRGRNYFPQDIEAAVDGSHPALRPGKCAAVAVDDHSTSAERESLVVVVEVNRGTLAGLDVGPVAAAVQAAVGRQFQIKVDALLLLQPGALPQTTSGKVRRSACGEGYLDGSLNTVGIWRRTPPLQ